MNTVKKIKQVIDAYSDCNTLSKAERDLKFKAKQSFTALEVMNTMKLALNNSETEYNEFNEQALQRVIDAFGPTARYYPAREGSVCLYVKIPNNTRVAFWRFTADEVSLEGNNTFRLWWD